MSPQEIFARAESTYTEALASLDPETRAAVRFGMWRDAEDEASDFEPRDRSNTLSIMETHRRDGASFVPAINWTHAWPGGFAHVDFVPMVTHGYRVCVGSCDDFGMAIDVDSLDEVRRVILSLPCIIDVADLLSRGFFYNC